MKKYDSYSQTNILWNSSMPSHWICEKTKKFFTNPKILNKGNVENNILSLTLNGVIKNNADRPIGLSPADYSTYQIFEANELVFKLIDLENISTSRVGLVYECGIMSSAYIRLRPRTDMNIKYFYYQYFDWYKRNIFNGLGAGVRQTLSAKDLIEYSIVVPPREEQDQIVRFLDWKVSEINRLINIKKKEINLLEEQVAVFISDIITNGSTHNQDMKPCEIEWIGKIPTHWNIMRCKYLFSERNERSIDGKETHLSMSQKYGLVPDEQLDERRMLSESYAGGKICYTGDLVLNRLKAHLGVFSLATQLGVISPDYTVLIPNTTLILPEFAEMVLKSQRCRQELRIRVRGVTEGFWRLYTDDFNTISIPVPPLDEQRQIMNAVSSYLNKIKQYKICLTKEIEVLSELKKHLISDVVTGQTDVRNIKIPEFEYTEEAAVSSEEQED